MVSSIFYLAGPALTSRPDRFPAIFRGRVQAALTVVWSFVIPGLQKTSPAQIVARVLSSNLGSSIRDYVFIDFCAGGGGPTPSIERHLNANLRATAGQGKSDEPVQFVLTDLHPHLEDWAEISKKSANILYDSQPVDASNAPPELIARYKAQGKKVFRSFHLSFHHMSDPLAKAILRNTVETSDAIG